MNDNDIYCLIPLTRGLITIVDHDDYERLAAHKWYAGASKGRFYAQRTSHGKIIKMHREIIDIAPSLFCDHINHNTLDNRRCNLRVCTAAQNARNRLPREDCTSYYKGVSWHKGNRKWQAEIRNNNEYIHLGYFDYELDAAIAYDDMAIELFGPFACLNYNHRPEIAEWIRQCSLF